MAKVARIGDATFGPCSACEASVSGQIVSGASKTICEGAKVARIGDKVKCGAGHSGTINSASPDVNVEGKAVARKGDTYSGTYSGTIVEGASKTFAN